MGSLTYDREVTVDVDDRTLAHLQVVIAAKLRRHEGFLFGWSTDMQHGGGRTTIWIHPRSVLEFAYRSSRMAPINPAWIDELAESANSVAGLRIVPEPGRDET